VTLSIVLAFLCLELPVCQDNSQIQYGLINEIDFKEQLVILICVMSLLSNEKWRGSRDGDAIEQPVHSPFSRVEDQVVLL